ncbi:MAG: hypothetical protein B7Z14_14925 [Bosea sp. 32-68-6]|nr:MAG: hypothetical protein B7Z14_14925 [Bosea sp. 32-68-6]
MTKRFTALDRAAAIAGGWGKLAGYIGVTPQAISQWKRVPTARVLAVERATGVSRHDLRPDIYPREESAPLRTDQQVA